MKKIDIHCHVAPFPQYQISIPDTSRTMNATEQLAVHDKLNVDIGVLLTCVSPEGTWGIGSNYATKFLADQYPDRFMWFCNVDPRQGNNSPTTDLSIILNRCIALGAKGLGELTASMYADDPMMDNLFYHCEQCQMPVLFHIAPKLGGHYGIVDDIGLPRIEKMLKKHPNLQFIGHSQCFWSEFQAGVTEATRSQYLSPGKIKEGRVQQLMREYGNLYCDLSAGSGMHALMCDPEYTAKFFEEFSDRIYYGTDACRIHHTFQYDMDAFLTNMVTTGMLRLENYEKIIRKNAEKLLGL